MLLLDEWRCCVSAAGFPLLLATRDSQQSAGLAEVR
jgi:hypothetical protein